MIQSAESEIEASNEQARTKMSEMGLPGRAMVEVRGIVSVRLRVKVMV